MCLPSPKAFDLAFEGAVEEAFYTSSLHEASWSDEFLKTFPADEVVILAFFSLELGAVVAEMENSSSSELFRRWCTIVVLPVRRRGEQQ